MSDIQEQEPLSARAALSEADEAQSVSCERISSVAIAKMRSELLELLDQYDATALELGRMHIPLKKSWATNLCGTDSSS